MRSTTLVDCGSGRDPATRGKRACGLPCRIRRWNVKLRGKIRDRQLYDPPLKHLAFL